MRDWAVKLYHYRILTPAAPSSADVVLASSVGQSFGLVGALVDAALKAQRDSHLNSVLTAQNFTTPAYFVDRLTQALTQENYTVVSAPVIRPNNKFMVTPPLPAPANVDAYLDVVIGGYGYIAAGIGSSNPYRPFLWLQVRLVSARDQSVLMQDIILYDPLGQPQHAVTIAPDPAYRFDDMDGAAEAPTTAVKGLQAAADAAAQTIAKQLR